MDELVLRNANLGLTMHRVNWNGEDVVWGDDMRDALYWGRTVDMLRTVDEDEDYYKILVSSLKSTCPDLIAKLQINQNGHGRPQKYVYLITRKGVMKLIATRRPHDVEGNNKWLAERLDKLQDWIFGEVLPAVLEHGVYVSEGVATAPQEIRDKVILDAIDRAVDKRLSEAMPQLMRRQWQINNAKTATAMQTASVLSRENKKLRKENSEQRLEIERLKVFETKDIEHRRKISEGVRRHNAGLSKEDVKDTRQLELPLRNLRRR